MILSKPLVPKHADGVLRVYRPNRTSTVTRKTAAIADGGLDAVDWLAGVYAGPVAECDFVPRGPGSSATFSGSVSDLANGPCDLVLVGEMRDLARNPSLLWNIAHDCSDSGVRLIAWRDGIDTADSGWELQLHLAVLRFGPLVNTKRRRKGVAAPKN